MSLRYQIAQKVHACTERFADRENDRVHDLIDLQLMEELIEQHDRVKQACVEVFALRATHPWAPTMTIEPNWPNTYATLAIELDFPVTDVADAAARVQALIDTIDHAETADRPR